MLTPLAKKKIRYCIEVRAELMKALNVGERSILNYMAKDHILLTTKVAVDAISKSTGLSENQIIKKQAA